MKLIYRIAVGAASTVVIYLAIALGLILSQSGDPVTMDDASGGGLDFSAQIAKTGPEPMALTRFETRDGAGQMARVYPGPSGAPLLVLVHGSGWHGLQFDELARQLQGSATVIAPDLRGHGETPQRRGDVDHIAQLEEDIADLVTATVKPGQKTVLAGHSSGGGLVVRFAGGTHGEMLDGAILLAPFLKYNAPTTRQNSGGWARPLTRRIIGLSMLNGVGITALNGLTAIRFNFPASVRNGPLGHTVTDAYSFRLNTAFAPRNDYLADIAKLPKFLLIAGLDDESFFAKEYQPLMSSVTDKGQYLLVPDQSHLAIVDAPDTRVAIEKFLQTLTDAPE